MSGKDPDYSFFENFESCYKIECKKEQANFVTEYTNYCKDTQFTYNNGNQVVHICKNMVKLYNSAILEHGYSKKHFTQNNVPEFINYWINKELTKAGINDDMRSQFCKKLDSITHNFDNQQLLKNKIYDIKKKDVKAMNILYEFYKIFYELAQKGNNYLQDFLVNFRKNYNEGLIKCFNGADVKFCHELNKYIKFYEQRKGQLSNICDNNKCPSLKKLTLLLSPSKKELLNIAENGYKLIGSLHISYLDGLYSTETDDYSNLKILISLQYNLLMEKDEDDKKCVMMKILKEYLQYFEKNKTNPKLQSFVHEFIDKYYKAKESEYQNIFTSCKPSDTSKEHCNIFKECIAKFNDDMSLIKKSSTEYIKNKDEYFKQFDPNESLLQKTLALFQDSEAMSRYSTTITSILISIFLCTFFLFKFTPLGSICRKKKKKKKNTAIFSSKNRRSRRSQYWT